MSLVGILLLVLIIMLIFGFPGAPYHRSYPMAAPSIVWVILLVLLILMLVGHIGCTPPRDCRNTWNPATTPPQCQELCDGEFVGPFLKAGECRGEPTPITLPEDQE